MKEFKKRYENLRDKASHFKQIIDTAPARAAEMRQVITQAVGEFQSLKDDFQVGTGAFPEVMEQITNAQDVFQEAGYELDRVEMEVGLNARLVLFLDREREVNLESLQVLRAENEKRVAVRSVLDALIKGEKVAARVDIPGMTFRTLAVEIGMAPCVRIFWEADPAVSDVIPPPLPQPATPVPEPPPKQQASSEKPGSMFGENSFFERRPATDAPPRPQEPAQATESQAVEPRTAHPPEPAATSSAPSSGTAAWKSGALDRFKKMPDLTR